MTDPITELSDLLKEAGAVPCLWLGRPPCPICGRDHGDRLVPIETDAELRAELVRRRPCRIQRKRTRGWRMPAGVVYVGRPGRYGNPLKASGRYPLAHNLIEFEDWVDHRTRAGKLDLEPLRGKDLACWCPVGAPCHGDVLIRRANL